MPFRLTCIASICLVIAACATTPRPAPLDTRAMVAAIDAAGQRITSVLEVTPLRDPDVTRLVDQARQARVTGQYDRSMHLLDQAQVQHGTSPVLLQERAETAILQHHFARAEQLARQSWSRGPRLGSLCARNWQTVMETRYAAQDPAGIERARKRRDDCRVKPVTRM